MTNRVRYHCEVKEDREMSDGFDEKGSRELIPWS